MASGELVWRWEQTPFEAWHGFTFWKPPAGTSPIRMEVSPFKGDRRVLDDQGGLVYQFGVSDCSYTKDVQEMRADQPELEVSGDRRSGVLVLDGDRIVAGFVIDGSQWLQSYRIVVDQEYRGRRLCPAMMVEWYRRVKRPKTIAPQKMNPGGVRAFLSGQHAVYAWAVQQGKEVRDEVLREMETKAQTNHILEMLARVEETGQAEVLGG